MTDSIDRVNVSEVSALTEKQFMGQVLELAKATGWMAYHTFDSRRSSGGFPDLVLVKPPRVIFAELKTDKKTAKLSQEQMTWLNAFIECSGVEVYLWRPRDWDNVTAVLVAQNRPEFAEVLIEEIG
jgi:Holliday junction resolvase